MLKKTIFYTVIFLLLLIPLVTVNSLTPFSELSGNPLSFINFVQRLSGLMLFVLITLQITLGSQLESFVQFLGARAYRFHIILGLTIYTLVFLHPVMEILTVFKLTENIVKAAAVIIPGINSTREIYLTYGKTALALIMVSVPVAYFRTLPFFRRNWHSFHFLNYVLFYLVFLHMRVGTDIMEPPFLYFSWCAVIIVSLLVIKRFILPIIRKIKAKYLVKQ